MSKDTGGPAFPIQGQQFTLGDKTYEPSVSGMTLRDYFAAKAMQGMLAGNATWRDLDFPPINGLNVVQNNAVLAYQIADAMLAERAK